MRRDRDLDTRCGCRHGPAVQEGAHHADIMVGAVFDGEAARLDELLFGDDVLLPSLATAQLAMRELRKRGLLPQS